MIARDAQHPGRERLAHVEVADARVGPDERFLRGVARLFRGREQPVAEAVDGLLVLLDKPREGRLVAARGRTRPFRLVGGARGPDQVGGRRQGEGKGECRVHGRSTGSLRPLFQKKCSFRSASRTASASTSGITVHNAPSLRKRKNGIFPLDPASSSTIRLATEATGVRFPARVETSARESQERCGSAILGTQWAARSTNGTLLTSWQAATVKAPNRNV